MIEAGIGEIARVLELYACGVFCILLFLSGFFHTASSLLCSSSSSFFVSLLCFSHANGLVSQKTMMLLDASS